MVDVTACIPCYFLSVIVNDIHCKTIKTLKTRFIYKCMKMKVKMIRKQQPFKLLKVTVIMEECYFKLHK